ncbi:MAG: 50S ribosomal protein L21 [Phycisphaerae bacterium]|nr:50S ribosomal protein L21 [Phycisphaerae bacterium]
MYAVIEDSGQQFRVAEGDVLNVDARDLDEGQTQVQFDRVLLISPSTPGRDGEAGDASKVKVGTPLVEGASVTGEVVDEDAKGPKVYSHKWRRRKSSRTKKGHRQTYLRVRITTIKG